MNFFAYGSLVFDEVIAAVTGARYAGSPAVLEGFARYLVKGATYPGLVPEPGSRVDGLVYHDVSTAAFDRLDRFEGEYYARRTVQVVADGGTVAAETYVFREEWRHLLSSERWDAEHFRRHHLDRFLGGYRGFDWIEPA